MSLRCLFRTICILLKLPPRRTNHVALSCFPPLFLSSSLIVSLPLPLPYSLFSSPFWLVLLFRSVSTLRVYYFFSGLMLPFFVVISWLYYSSVYNHSSVLDVCVLTATSSSAIHDAQDEEISSFVRTELLAPTPRYQPLDLIRNVRGFLGAYKFANVLKRKAQSKIVQRMNPGSVIFSCLCLFNGCPVEFDS